jgi:hypothetical protein
MVEHQKSLPHISPTLVCLLGKSIKYIKTVEIDGNDEINTRIMKKGFHIQAVKPN